MSLASFRALCLYATDGRALGEFWAAALRLWVNTAGLLIGRRARSGVPSKPQLLWETVVGQIQDQVRENIGIKTAPGRRATSGQRLLLHLGGETGWR
ncbi:hypothetical protein [Fodinicola feengrottensis]|uniref:hypothetical protein n=1 Tax=Fodinicola feengrottensis TaxID=435914 RepID=UPI00244336E8|nr:hypothetical protein [Fodinicola feengrottensis]